LWKLYKKVYLLEELKKDEKKYKKITSDKNIHKILVCKTNEELNEYRYVDRDTNSTKNMVKIVIAI